MSADLDGDDLKDIVTGGWWYKNPGSAKGDWPRRTLGKDANNAAMISDFDGDGDLDVFSSTWNTPREWTFYEKLLRKLGLRSYYEQGGFVWSRNGGQGRFTVLRNIESGNGDFLQGIASIPDDKEQEIILSWHEPDLGLQSVHVPEKPLEASWKLDNLSDISQDEALSTADINNDGKLDLILGTKWLRKEENGKWAAFTLHKTEDNPDRNSAVDINGDGNIDIVIGYEAISVPGKLAWYEQNGDPTQLWDEHVVAEVIGPMSLSVIDMDSDGDLDIVVGEHNLAHPELARLMWFENLSGDAMSWTQHLVYVGDEHHDGAHVVDIDNDGDMDIVSIGWGHDRLILYENLRNNEVRVVE